jgi:hypothetical protein
MDSSVSPKDEIWFLHLCHHISNAVYHQVLKCKILHGAYASCVLYGPQNKQKLLRYTFLGDWCFITEVESVCCAVGTESLYKTHVKLIETSPGTQLWLFTITSGFSEFGLHSEERKPFPKNKQIYVLGFRYPPGPLRCELCGAFLKPQGSHFRGHR